MLAPLATPKPTPAPTPDLLAPHRAGAFFASLPLPGLGLAIDGHPWWGLAALAGVAGGSGWIVAQYNGEQAAYDSYKAATTRTDAENRWNEERMQNALFVSAQVVTGAIYAVQAVAAAVAAPRRTPKRHRGPQAELLVAPAQLALTVRW
jgi:hypothetical protein